MEKRYFLDLYQLFLDIKREVNNKLRDCEKINLSFFQLYAKLEKSN